MDNDTPLNIWMQGSLLSVLSTAWRLDLNVAEQSGVGGKSIYVMPKSVSKPVVPDSGGEIYLRKWANMMQCSEKTLRKSGTTLALVLCLRSGSSLLLLARKSKAK